MLKMLLPNCIFRIIRGDGDNLREESPERAPRSGRL